MAARRAHCRVHAALAGLALVSTLAKGTLAESPAPAPAAPAASSAAPPADAASEAKSSLVRYRLPNGLRVVLDADRSESSAVVCLTLALGTRHEPEGKDGAAWLLSRLDGAERGTAAVKAKARFDRTSGSSHVHVNVDDTQWVARVPPAGLSAAIELAALRFAPLRASPGGFAALRNAALRDLEQEHAPSLEAAGERRVRQLVFQGLWPYAHAGPGSERGLLALALADLQLLQERHVTPDSAVLSISGLFSEGEARSLIREHLGRLSGRAADAPSAQPVPRQTSERFSAGVDRRATVPLAFYAWPLPAADERERRSLQTVAELLAGSAQLRAASASGTPDIDDVRAWLLPQRGPSALAVRLRINPRSNVDKARGVLERELQRLASAGPTEAELEAARARLDAQHDGALDSALVRAPALAKSELHGGDARGLLRRAEEFAKIKASDVREEVRTHLTETKRTTVELYPRGWPQDLPPEVVRRQHIVKAGENLIQIAKRYHSSVEAIAAANRIKTHRFIYPGQELVIPVKTADVERAKKRSYTVKSGDTLMGIAARFGVSTRALAEANRRRREQPIRIGETLILPEVPREAVAAQKAKAKLRQHRVKRGDSLLGLARHYGVSAAEIAAANGRRESQPILAGELLVIPSPARAEGSSPAAAKPGRSKPAAKPRSKSQRR